MEVTASGEPVPTFTWSKNGVAIAETDRIRMTASEGTTTLTINDCILDDEAVYLVKAENIFGHAIAEINVQILGTKE